MDKRYYLEIYTDDGRCLRFMPYTIGEAVELLKEHRDYIGLSYFEMYRFKMDKNKNISHLKLTDIETQELNTLLGYANISNY